MNNTDLVTACRKFVALVTALKAAGVPVGKAAVAVNKVVMQDTSHDILGMTGFLPDSATYSLTGLAGVLGKTTRQVNRMLADAGYQVMVNKRWVLTTKGEEYGTRLNRNSIQWKAAIKPLLIQWSSK